jgi:cobalt-zinc-cadmium efflux system protein
MHNHSHGHEHSTSSPPTSAFAIASLLNLAFVLIQAFFAIRANSMSLLADAGHNLGDVIGLLLSWGAAWLLTKQPSQRYSYGFKRTTILAALTNAVLLVATSAIIGYESIHKILSPEPVESMAVIVVAFLGILINGGTSLLFLKDSAHDLNTKSAFMHLAADALLSFGVVLTGVLMYFTHWYWLDPLVGLALVATILVGTWGLLRDSMNLMLDAVPHNVNRFHVREYLLNLKGVTEVHDLHIWGLSTRENALTVHLIMPGATLSEVDYHHINHDLHEKFNINHVTIQIETGDSQQSCAHGQSC